MNKIKNKVSNEINKSNLRLTKSKRFKIAAIKAFKGIWNSLPTLLGVILLIGLIDAFIPSSFYSKLFNNNAIFNLFIGSGLGSILAGNPVTSYVLGGELLKQGVGLMAVTAFLVSWVTVGLVQLPAESIMLSKKFAIIRNITAFLFAIIVAVIVVVLYNLI